MNRSIRDFFPQLRHHPAFEHRNNKKGMKGKKYKIKIGKLPQMPPMPPMQQFMNAPYRGEVRGVQGVQGMQVRQTLNHGSLKQLTFFLILSVIFSIFIVEILYVAQPENVNVRSLLKAMNILRIIGVGIVLINTLINSEPSHGNLAIIAAFAISSTPFGRLTRNRGLQSTGMEAAHEPM